MTFRDRKTLTRHIDECDGMLLAASQQIAAAYEKRAACKKERDALDDAVADHTDIRWADTEDHEYWTCTEAEEALWETDVYFRVGDIVTLYWAEFVSRKASDFLCINTACNLSEAAYEDCTEVDWDMDVEELQKHIQRAVDQYCDDNDCQPGFGRMKNITASKFRITEIEVDPEAPDDGGVMKAMEQV